MKRDESPGTPACGHTMYSSLGRKVVSRFRETTRIPRRKPLPHLDLAHRAREGGTRETTRMANGQGCGGRENVAQRGGESERQVQTPCRQVMSAYWTPAARGRWSVRQAVFVTIAHVCVRFVATSA